MTYEDFEKRITKMAETPDTILAALPDFLKDVKADYEGFTSVSNKLSENEKRIRDLQDTNMKLFLMQTNKRSDAEEIEDDEKEGADAIDAFVAKLNKEE